MPDTERCPGSDHHAGVGDTRIDADHVACPMCGRRTQSSRMSGKLARHNRPVPPAPFTIVRTDYPFPRHPVYTRETDLGGGNYRSSDATELEWLDQQLNEAAEVWDDESAWNTSGEREYIDPQDFRDLLDIAETMRAMLDDLPQREVRRMLVWRSQRGQGLTS